MRSVSLLIAGIVIGLAISAAAQTQNRGIVGLNHVALSVPESRRSGEVLHQNDGISRSLP